MPRSRACRSSYSNRIQLTVGARSSRLSRVQFQEIQEELPYLDLKPVWVETSGDKDRVTSLRGLEKTDFFTREIDVLLLEGKIDAAIHSAKDLPEPLPKGLCIAALTQGIDARDSLVLRAETPHIIATSSVRREQAVRRLYPDISFIDLRGTIDERLAKLEKGEADGVVVAEAALIRLGLTHVHRVYLPGETAPLQGRLAVVTRIEDKEIQSLFGKINAP